MKIALLYHDAFAPGGYPRDVRWLAGAFSHAGHEVRVLGRRGPTTDGLGTAALLDDSTAWDTAVDGCDVLHAFGVSNRFQIKALRNLAGRADRLAFSPIAHMMREHVRVGSPMKRPVYKTAGKWLERRDALGHFFSQLEKSESAPYFSPKQAFIAGAGIFPDDMAAQPRSAAEEYILFFGRNDVHQKGLDLLANGYESAVKAGFDMPLVIGGRAQGDSAEWLNNVMSRPALKGLVRSTGETSDEERSRLMRDATAFIFPSRWDGPPRPVREAIALGVPVLITPGTNMTEEVTQHGGGRVVEPSGEGIKEALLDTTAQQIATWREEVPRLRDALRWPNIAELFLDAYAR